MAHQGDGIYFIFYYPLRTILDPYGWICTERDIFFLCTRAPPDHGLVSLTSGFHEYLGNYVVTYKCVL